MYFVECPSVICLNLFDVFLMVLGKTMMVSHGFGEKSLNLIVILIASEQGCRLLP